MPNLSFACRAICTPRHTRRAKSIIITSAPISPSSSQTMAKIKSFWGLGRYIYFCLDCPSPTPNRPPEPMAYKDCLVCQVASFSSKGFSHTAMRSI